MAKTMTFGYLDKNYTLEFTRRTIELMEKEGFVITELANQPVTMIPRLFAGAFKAHHSTVGQDIINAIFNRINNKQALFTKLGEMYEEPIKSLLEDTDNKEGNIQWEASW